MAVAVTPTVHVVMSGNAGLGSVTGPDIANPSQKTKIRHLSVLDRASS